MFGVELPLHSQTLHINAQTLRHAAEQLQEGKKKGSLWLLPLWVSVQKQSGVTHLFLHGVWTVWRGSGQKRRQVGVQRVLWLGSEGEHLYPRVQTPKLHVQTAHIHTYTQSLPKSLDLTLSLASSLSHKFSVWLQHHDRLCCLTAQLKSQLPLNPLFYSIYTHTETYTHAHTPTLGTEHSWA